MTLDAEFAQYQGQSVLVPGQAEALRGQCFMWFDFVLHDVYNLPYFYAEGAIDIWNNPGWLLGHFDKITDGSIKKGDIVVFNMLVGSIYGHVDVAMQDGTIDSFLGSDTNWSGNKTVHYVQHTGRQYVLGSLRLKGGSTDVPITDQQLYHLIQGLTGRDAQLSEIQNPKFYSDPGFAIDTFWNNGGSDRFASHSEAQVKQIESTRDEFGKIADSRYANEKQVADLVGVANPDDVNSVVAKVKDLLTSGAQVTKDSVIKYIQDKLT